MLKLGDNMNVVGVLVGVLITLLILFVNRKIISEGFFWPDKYVSKKEKMPFKHAEK